VGALAGAAAGAFAVSKLDDDKLISGENRRREKDNLPEMEEDQKTAFLKTCKTAVIAGFASAGGATGLNYATDVNANNLAVTRGASPKSGFNRLNDAAGAGFLGGLVGFVAGARIAAKATGHGSFGTGKAAKHSRERAWKRPYV
jgi:hypothetical protein